MTASPTLADVENLFAEVSAIQAQVADLQASDAELEKRVAAVEGGAQPVPTPTPTPVPTPDGDYITTDGPHNVPVKLQAADGRKLAFAEDGTFSVDGVQAVYGKNIKQAGLKDGKPYQFADWSQGHAWFDVPPLQTPGSIVDDPFAELPAGSYPAPGPTPNGMTNFADMTIGTWGNRIVRSDWGTGSGRTFSPANAFKTAEGYMVCRHVGGSPDTSGEFGMNANADWKTRGRFKARTYIKDWLQGQVRAFLWLFDEPQAVWEIDIEGIGDGTRLCLHGPGQPNDGSGLWFLQTGLKPIGEHEWWIDYVSGEYFEIFLDGQSISGRITAANTINNTFPPAGFAMRALFSNWSGEWAGPVGTQTDDMVVYDYGVQDI